jgi:transposase
VADLVGLSVITTRDVLKRWNESGPDGLTDGRKNNGSESELTDGRRAQLLAALKKRPPDGGLWSGPKVARYVRTTWGIEIAPQTGWKWLADLGFTLQVPRPSHPRAADPAARKRWKKTYDSG